MYVHFYIINQLVYIVRHRLELVTLHWLERCQHLIIL